MLACSHVNMFTRWHVYRFARWHAYMLAAFTCRHAYYFTPLLLYFFTTLLLQHYYSTTLPFASLRLAKSGRPLGPPLIGASSAYQKCNPQLHFLMDVLANLFTLPHHAAAAMTVRSSICWWMSFLICACCACCACCASCACCACCAWCACSIFWWISLLIC